MCPYPGGDPGSGRAPQLLHARSVGDDQNQLGTAARLPGRADQPRQGRASRGQSTGGDTVLEPWALRISGSDPPKNHCI